MTYEMHRITNKALDEMEMIYDTKNRRFRNTKKQAAFREWKKNGGADKYAQYLMSREEE